MPSGQFLMEDFAYAGGLQPRIRQLVQRDMLHRKALTVNGKTIWDNAATAEVYNPDVIRPLNAPLTRSGGIATLKGNLAPNSAVIKPSAATPALMKHTGRAVVFEDIEDYRGRINDPALDIDETCVMVLKTCGPRGYPGMAEVGNMGLPAKILPRGVTDMVRISDARMSGTAYGTVVLHVAPEAALGGPLALVRNGDAIALDVEKRSLQLEVSETELIRRRTEWMAPSLTAMPGYQTLEVQHTLQADRGCDLDFLVGPRQASIPCDSH
jgi:dihydroxy-acid dehydratase